MSMSVATVVDPRTLPFHGDVSALWMHLLDYALPNVSSPAWKALCVLFRWLPVPGQEWLTLTEIYERSRLHSTCDARLAMSELMTAKFVLQDEHGRYRFDPAGAWTKGV